MTHSTRLKAQKSLSAQLYGLIFLGFSFLGLTGLYLLQNPGHLAIWDVFGLIGLGFIGIWRWSWFVFRVIRARIYLHWVFPRWRRQANKIPIEHLPPVCFLVPTYKEKPWITERVFRAIAREAQSLAHPITLLVNSSSDEENAAILAILKSEDPDLSTLRLIQMTQKDGKRKAMADSLQALARLNLPPDTVVALMDGDSELAPGTLRQCLAFFRMFPKMGALTTDELPIVKGSDLFSEWFHLRFAQRHLQMCSDALSHKVMCLTGRFSLFRAEAALHPSFAAQLEHDSLHDWLWGQFRFLSGDDKSTWYWLLQRGYDMLYIPDAIVYSIETVSGSILDRAYQNMRRWYGNMLRNNSRAIALGPKSMGWFIWYGLLDQRISFWTCLITPGFLVVSFLLGNWTEVGVLISWIFFSRPLMLAIIFWERVSNAKLIHFPLLLMSQWGSALVKIWTQMNLAQQNWANRGGQQVSAAGPGISGMIKLNTSRFLLFAQLFSFVVFLCWLSGLLNPTWDLAGLHLNRQAVAQQSSIQSIDAIDYDILPGDGQDDAAPLQALIASLSPQDIVEINLPMGELDLFYPLEINRNNLTLKGHGVGRTVLQAHFDQTLGQAVLRVQPEATSTSLLQTSSNLPAPTPKIAPAQVHNIHFSDFTLRHVLPAAASAQAYAVDSIVLEKLVHGSVTNLYLEQSGRHPLVLNQTQDIKVEYFMMENSLNQGQIMRKDDVNTQTRGLTLPSASS
ncbi:MAG: glycosyltransferase family 2 protein [Cyanothece sp. SIO1E1]|nr:glycosyltransferase family 2 protein [Cyanothece sp. SIO1E1]